MNVYEVLNKIHGDICQTGIGKDQYNKAQKFSFRGIDDVYNALSGLMAKHGLLSFPSVVKAEHKNLTSKNGSMVIYTYLTVKYKFVSAHDASKEETTVEGEAMDYGDKSTAKALTAAHKAALLQVLAIPTEASDADYDENSYDIAPKKEPLPSNGPVFERALQSFIKNGNLDLVSKHYEISDEVKDLIVNKAMELKAQ